MEETSKDRVDSVQSLDLLAEEAVISDDLLAAEILMQLSEQKPTPKPLRWGFRQPRSRQISRSGILQAKEMETSRARASPTTPLSWSGGSSGSADGCEESSRSRKRLAGVLDDEKSKIPANEATPLKLTIRRTKKKTHAELKKEVDLLLLEKSNLKKEFESLDNVWKDLRVKNEGLKKLQLRLEIPPPKEMTKKASDASAKADLQFDLNLPAPEEEAAFGPDDIYGTS